MNPPKKNLAKAEKLIEPLIEKYKEIPHIQDTGAWVYYRQGEYEKARELLSRVEGKAGDNPAMSYHLGMIYLKLGEKAKARKNLQQALNSKEPFHHREEAKKALRTARE